MGFGNIWFLNGMLNAYGNVNELQRMMWRSCIVEEREVAGMGGLCWVWKVIRFGEVLMVWECG